MLKGGGLYYHSQSIKPYINLPFIGEKNDLHIFLKGEKRHKSATPLLWAGKVQKAFRLWKWHASEAALRRLSFRLWQSHCHVNLLHYISSICSPHEGAVIFLVRGRPSLHFESFTFKGHTGSVTDGH